MRKLFLVLVICTFGCQQKNDLPVKISLNTNWQFKGVDTLNWNTATVLGNVFSDLLSHQIIEDPFIKNNEEKVQWVTNKDWEYKTTFTLSNKILSKKNIEINFKGLDTYTAIYLNDSLIGKTENAFRVYNFDIRKFAKEDNQLKIIFKNSNEIGNIKAKKNRYELPEGNRIYTRKAQFQTGWDWGPKLNTSGIWKAISINAFNEYKIENISIRQNRITDSIANFTVQVDEYNKTKEGLKYEVYINNTLQPVRPEKPAIPITIKNPKLWWTHNLGEPYLYDIKVIVKKNNTILDSISTKYGIRTINLITKKDSIGESFYFELNGKPIYMKGANYIPQNSFQNNVTNQHYEKLLSDVVNSNMNMLRVWGGGIYENDIFYDLCDAKGILVWQDFMFACAMYPGDKTFLENITIEAEQQVKRLRNHPSIALWCGNNENSEGWKRWGWQANRTKQEKEAIWSDYLAVFDSILPNVVAKYSETDYWETSPKYGRGNPKYKTEGDAHDWWVWHDAYPFEHLQNNVPRFMSEFGFQSFPSFEVLNFINQKEEIDLNTSAIKSHQKHMRGFQLIEEYMARDYKIPSKDEDYAYVSQLLQAKGIVMGIEAHRRAKPYNMGTLFWQLNDCWPAISWSSIDYFGNWKALQYRAKKAFENIAISSVVKDDIVSIYLVNDTFNNVSDYLSVDIVDFDGTLLWTEKQLVTLDKDSSKKILDVDLSKIKINLSKTYARIKFNSAFKISFFKKPKDLILENREIIKSITKFGDHQFLITLESETLQKDVFLHSSEKGYFTDNFFDLEPNTVKTLFFKTEAKSLENLNIKSLNSIR